MITANMVKELREATGAGMLDCKKALTETNGNMEEAITWLREKGISKAAKKQTRIAAEGLAKAKVEGNKAVIVEVNSETDFVAKNDEFQKFVSAVAEQAMATKTTDVEEFLAEKWALENEKTVKEAGEKIRYGDGLCFRSWRVAWGKRTLPARRSLLDCSESANRSADGDVVFARLHQ